MFLGNLVVLINGFPTLEVSIHLALKQDDLLSPFLFLLVAEGLSGLISRENGLNLLSGVRVWSSDLTVSYLQYACDRIILADDNTDNLRAIKAILRGFELTSGLRVNFLKSSLIGVNSN